MSGNQEEEVVVVNNLNEQLEQEELKYYEFEICEGLVLRYF